jgi:hypothetical protein
VPRKTTKRPATKHTKAYPTWGDLAREQLRRLGVPYFSDVQLQIGRRLTRSEPAVRKAFAITCAHRLLCWHEALPRRERRPFTLSWRPVVDAMWKGIATDAKAARQRVSRALDAYHAGPFDHDDGPDGPDDADEDAAAACISAAQCYLASDAESARHSAGRAVDRAFKLAQEELELDPNDFEWDPAADPMPLAKENMHPAVQGELARQVADLDLLRREGVTPEVLRRLRSDRR